VFTSSAQERLSKILDFKRLPKEPHGNLLTVTPSIEESLVGGQLLLALNPRNTARNKVMKCKGTWIQTLNEPLLSKRIMLAVDSQA